MPVSAAHIAPSTGGFEPQRTFDFQVELYGIPGANLIRLAVESAFFPSGRNDVIPIQYFAEERKVAGQVKFDDGQIVCHDYVDENTAGVLLAWRDLVYNPITGALGYASQYKKEASIVLLGPDGSRERVFRVLGCWPSAVTGDNPSMTSNDALKVTMTLIYDQAIPEF